LEKLTSEDLAIFFLALGVLLSVARILGEIAVRWRQPAVVGEILAGILLGPTLFGVLAPDLFQTIFPQEGIFPLLFQGLSTLAIALFLLVAGMEVDLSSVWRQGKTASIIGVVSLLVPFVTGFALGRLAPTALGAEPGADPMTFSLFFATAMSISALPVVAKILRDLELFRSDLGAVIVAAATLNDLVGWIIFAIILSLMGGAGAHVFPVEWTVGLTLCFTFLMLTVGPWLIHRVIPWIQAHTTWPGGILGFSLAGALFCAAFTEWIGIHAIFGTFLFGVALGDSSHLRERTKSTIDQFVSFIFAPLFFAGIGLNIDFGAHFDPLLTVIVLLVATLVKLGGSRLGGYLSGLPAKESWAVGFGLNARGAMEIILGLLALEAGLIGERLFVAMVIMALVTSLCSGTAMQLILKLKKGNRFLDYLPSQGFCATLQATDRQSCIQELSAALCEGTQLDPERTAKAAWSREQIMSTGLPNRMAVPHARLEGIKTGLVAVGFSKSGIDFDSQDGLPARLIFLILTPADDHRIQIEILSDIARTFRDPEMVEKALRSGNFTEFRAFVKSEPSERLS
jgi:Kef-type K+ transport system membrane component KefB/mannitol/fructose-specific phosphotransferase system IIA component